MSGTLMPSLCGDVSRVEDTKPKHYLAIFQEEPTRELLGMTAFNEIVKDAIFPISYCQVKTTYSIILFPKINIDC